ncbi:MAG: hypothetical protein GY932_06520 [Arcobacter sp.]|nr:hypothetical protein [Arcobacter sp.]
MKITLLRNPIIESNDFLKNENDSYEFLIEGISSTLVDKLKDFLDITSKQSLRDSLDKLKKEYPFSSMDTLRASKYISISKDNLENKQFIKKLEELRITLQKGIQEDISKYTFPKNYKLSLNCNIKIKDMIEIFLLGNTSNSDYEIKNLSRALYKSLSKEHKTIFEDYL